ncbi:L-cysteine S-thiosulfotransferase subunit SoxA [Usitatibacter rugosus]|uniref:L-cysteine S-thiosulfotransferase subunit SoxA n=1 Tax=Usitatibacter rugosus TaxID=2732067 RepID=A0A6M4GTP6_9PROT|nr:sulfur oxidation c-type cytochrome SoxA [Usitatibacter rugosus]QJR10412.1 L-cysteine S-thiosulfotransferase subunit SoxA [Usitatibacter rugosus]
MRCPDRILAAFALALLTCAGPVLAAADAVRAEAAAKLKSDLPSLAPADYVLGSAAFDAELRSQLAENANAATTSGVLEAGRAAWTRKFKNGRTLASCFPNGGRRIAGAYPQYDARLKRVVTLETAINQCLKTNAEPLLDIDDGKSMGAVTAYVRSLSQNQKVAVRVPAAAEAAFDQGRRLYTTRMGQQNWACASCHVQGAGKRYAGQPLSPAIGQGASSVVIRGGQAVTLQARVRECLERMGVAPFAAGSDELNNLEYYLTYLSNGLALQASPWRAPRATRG